jgi:DNA helicase-2/ATP-dependent DNA helicase PcrA
MDHRQAFEEAIERLNPGQKKAVETLDGPVMVIAGPGTGKTQVIAARIGNILKETDSGPENILCLTYTEAATIAMRNRLIQFIGPTAYNVHINTFHAFCNNVIQDNIRYFGGVRDLQVINDLEEIELYENMIDDLPNDHILKRLTGDIYYERDRLKGLFQNMKKENWSSEFVIKRVDQYLVELPLEDGMRYKRDMPKQDKKKGDLKPEYYKAVERMELLKAAALLFDEYNKRLKTLKRYDFHDMIIWVLNAFKTQPNLLLDYQERFHYFLVDEYQDTNGAQNDLLYQLCSYWDAPNVFVVGDDDQSIYRFQGANMDNILAYKEKFKGHLAEVVLTDNYRSTQAILDGARHLILEGKERLEAVYPEISKSLTARAYNDNGQSAVITTYYNTEHEKADIIRQLHEAYKAGEDLSEIAVIYRNHSQVDEIVSALERKGVPLNLRKKLDVLQEVWIEQLIDILRYIDMEGMSPFSGEPLLAKIMHFRYFNIHPLDIAKIALRCGYDPESRKSYRWRDILNDDEALSRLRLKNLKAIKLFRDNVERWIKDSFNETVQVLFQQILNYGDIMGHLLSEHDKAWKMQLLTTLFDFIKEESRRISFMKVSDLINTIDKMQKYKVGLPVQRMMYNAGGVNFVTAHSSKGLEFSKVYIIGAISNKWEGKRPNTRAYKLPPTIFSKSSENVLEDERRLFYVGMTRAKEHLHISYSAQTPEEKALQRSRFLVELVDSGVVKTNTPSPKSLSDEDMFDYGVSRFGLDERPQLAFVDHAVAEKVLEKFKLSVTALNKYLQCPISFYFDNILKVPSARTVHTGFGQAIHRTLELMHDESRKPDVPFPSVERMMELFDESMSLYHSHFTKKEYQDRSAFGHQFLPNYYKEYVASWQKVPDFIMEYNINQAVCGEVPIKGRLDRVEVGPNGVHVIDYKTGNRSNSVKKLKGPQDADDRGGDYWRQIVYYRILIENDTRNNWKFNSGAFDFVQPDKSTGKFIIDNFQVTDEEVSIVKNQITSTFASIQNHEFEKGCGEEDCTWCNFVKYNQLDMLERTEDGEPDDDNDLYIE